MSRNVAFSLTILFLLSLSLVGMVQAIVELGENTASSTASTDKTDEISDTTVKSTIFRKGSPIQILDVLEDTFINPRKNKNNNASMYATFLQQTIALRPKIDHLTDGDSSLENWTTTEEVIEDLLYSVSDIKKGITTINRHRSLDKPNKHTHILDSLHILLSKLFQNVQDQQEIHILKKAYSDIMEYSAAVEHNFQRVSIIEYPVITVQHFIKYTIFNREYLRKYEDELEKTSIFANTLRPYMQFFRYITLRDWGEKALGGKNGWLFYKQGVDFLLRPNITDSRTAVVDPEDTPIRESAIDTIVAFRDELARLSIDLVVMIAPGKASIYPDVLSNGVAPDKSGTFGHSIQIMKLLQERSVQTIDIFTPLSEARKNDVVYGDSLYLSHDTHWNTRGVRVVAKTVAEWVKSHAIAQELSQTIEFILDTVTVIRKGDIRDMANLPDFNFGAFSVPSGTQKIQCYQVYQVNRNHEGTIESKFLFRDDFKRSKILILGDSFSRIFQTDEPRSAGWISHLAYELSQPMCSIVSDGGASTLVREKLIRKASVLRGKKLVIWEFVERDFRYGAEGWKHLVLPNN